VCITGDGDSKVTKVRFRCTQKLEFFFTLSITLIFSCLHGVLNVGKKITNYTVYLEITR
jgi:hypothetical protein